MLQLIDGRRKREKMEENALKGDIYNGSDFTARRDLRDSSCLKSRGRTGKGGLDGRKGRRDDGVKRKKGSSRTFENGTHEVGRRRRDGT